MVFPILTLLTALALAAVAGWFSIIGFMTIYAGFPMYAVIMGVVTEIAKLVTASWLYRNWSYASWKLKLPLIYFTITLMVITSIGVFGFLSKAHLEQGSGVLDNAAKIESLQFQIDREKAIIADNEKVIAQLDATVNSFLGSDRADRALNVRRTQARQREALRQDTATAQKRIDELSAEKFKYESEIRKLELEVGPIRYIAELIYGVEENSTKNIESAVRIFTLLLVSTLDPLAVILLIAANHTLLRLKREKEEKNRKTSSGDGTCQNTENKSSNEVGGKVSNKDIFFPAESISTSVDDKEAAYTKKETPVSSEVLQESSEDLNEKEKIPEVTENTNKSENALSLQEEAVYEENAKRYEEMANSGKSVEDRGSAEVQPIQENVNEEKSSTLEKFFFPEGSTSIPIIRSPGSSTVYSESETGSAGTREFPKRSIPWAQQETVLRELLGTNSPHFIPQKIDEEEKDKKNSGEKDEIKNGSYSKSSEITDLQENEAQEIPAIGQEEISKKNEFEKSTMGIGITDNSFNKKYPNTLNWIKVFKGLKNGQ